jgi:SAM-dependent methyltransferase
VTVPEDFRVQSRTRWARTAGGWGANADRMRATTMPVSAWMIDALAPQPGHDLLELAAGTGDTGFLAAELIQPGGTLICSDFSPEMLSQAQRRAEALGIRNVRFKQIDAETSIDLPAASQDGVLCRWGYMLMADQETALRETRRVLRPGARVSLAAWTGPDENLWSAALVRALIRRGLIERPDPAAPGQFAWAREGLIAERLEAAGFSDPVVERVAFRTRFGSVEEWWRVQISLSMTLQDGAARLDRAGEAELLAELAEVAAPFAQPDGGLAIPAVTWVAAAAA